ncbi:MAG TPA: ArsC/Spx/MgsR family protein [Pyrinomonadaceae bacterium]|jgi:arsenate reductase|nr:ArsC/Spx/MgsR family protein [Pyrinomonadaceae bacterium]
MDRLLRESGIPYEKVNYYREPLSEAKLRDLLAKMKVGPRAILRTRESLYRELKLDQSTFSDDELIRLMIEHPDLIQRPIVERGDRAVLGRPVDNVKDLLESGV